MFLLFECPVFGSPLYLNPNPRWVGQVQKFVLTEHQCLVQLIKLSFIIQIMDTFLLALLFLYIYQLWLEEFLSPVSGMKPNCL